MPPHDKYLTCKDIFCRKQVIRVFWQLSGTSKGVSFFPLGNFLLLAAYQPIHPTSSGNNYLIFYTNIKGLLG